MNCSKHKNPQQFDIYCTWCKMYLKYTSGKCRFYLKVFSIAFIIGLHIIIIQIIIVPSIKSWSSHILGHHPDYFGPPNPFSFYPIHNFYHDKCFCIICNWWRFGNNNTIIWWSLARKKWNFKEEFGYSENCKCLENGEKTAWSCYIGS